MLENLNMIYNLKRKNKYNKKITQWLTKELDVHVVFVKKKSKYI